MPDFSVLMVVAEYPATHGHNTVINNLASCLKKMGIRAAIGAFSFKSNPPNGIEKILLDKSMLLRKGVSYLDFDIIHSHQPRVNYYLLFRKPTKPVVFHYHGPSNLIHKINFKLSMKLFGKRISKIIAVSQTALIQMNELVGQFPSQIVYNGVDTELFNTNLRHSHKKGVPQLLFVSALRPYKKTEVLINAMPLLLQKYQNAHLQIVGGGPNLTLLKKLVAEKKLEEHVEFVGEIQPPKDLATYYASCDVYVSASLLEACPVPPFEAMACGKPLVLSNIAAHNEIISISNAGVVFIANDPSSLCEKISAVYEQKDSFGMRAVEFAKKHDWNSTGSQLVEIYENLLKQDSNF
jgi:glycosyltransferase involved in cell wall biosynthesis